MDEVNIGPLARMQSERINDAIVQIRCDSRVLAGLALYFAQRGVLPTSPAQLVRLAMESFHQVLLDNKVVEEVMTVGDATRVLSQLGLSRVNPSNRGRRAYMMQLQRDERILSGLPDDPRMSLKLKQTKTIRNKQMKELEQTAMEVMPEVLRQLRRTTDEEDVKKMKDVVARVPEGLIVKDE